MGLSPLPAGRWMLAAAALGLMPAMAAMAATRSPAPGPGIPHVGYEDSALFAPLSTFHSPAGTSWGNGVMLNGYLLIGIDVDEDSSGFQVWDISDPRAPRMLAQKYDAESKRLREIQNFSFAYGYGRTLAAIPSHEGVEIWDFTDITDPHRHGAVDLAHGGGRAIYNGVISAFWQPPYIYCGGMDGGIYIVDAADPAHPRIVKNIPNSALNGRLSGPIFALGTLLVATTMEFLNENCAITTFDISDPAEPQIGDRYACGSHEGNYTAFLNGNHVYGMGSTGRLQVYEVSGFDVYKQGQDSVWVGHGGYGMFADGYVHAGMSNWYVKYDVSGFIPRKMGRFRVDGDNDWVLPIGNLAFVGDDDGPTSPASLTPHQAGPDTSGPVVNWAVPNSGAVHVAVTARIGLSFTDNIDFASVDSHSIVLRRVGGDSPGGALPGKVSVLEALVNFTPDRPLEPSAEYEVFIRAGGLRDWGGTASPRDTVIRFTTEYAPLGLAGRAGKAGNRRPQGDYRLLWPASREGVFPGPGVRNLLGRGFLPGTVTGRSRMADGLFVAPVAR